MRGFSLLPTGLFLLCWLPLPAAGQVCSGAELVSAAGCQTSPECRLTGRLEVGRDCLLDLGPRSLRLASTAVVAVGSGHLAIRAAGVTLEAGAFIDARGADNTSPSAIGGHVLVETEGDVTLEMAPRQRSRIDASAGTTAGSVALLAGGSIRVRGRLLAAHRTGVADGGFLRLQANGEVVLGSEGELSVTAGARAPAGAGVVSIEAGRGIVLEGSLDASGSEGGTVRLEAPAGGVRVGAVRLDSTGSGGSGGRLSIEAGGPIEVDGPIHARGNALTGTFGGDGGAVDVRSRTGPLLVRGAILAEGAAPGGSGGSLALLVDAAQRLGLTSLARLSVRGSGPLSPGGAILLLGGGEVDIAAPVDASGGATGGAITLDAAHSVLLTGAWEARGRGDGSRGGEVLVAAGNEGAGNLTLTADLDVGAGGCSLGECGEAGRAQLRGCQVRLASSGRVLARAAGSGGEVTLTGRETVEIAGSILASATTSSGEAGRVGVEYPVGSPPILRPGSVVPLPDLESLPGCEEGSSQAGDLCLSPCAARPTVFPEPTPDSTPLPSPSGPSTSPSAEPSPTPENPAPGGSPTFLPTASPATPSPSPSATVTPTPLRSPSPSPSPTPSVLPRMAGEDVVLLVPGPLTLRREGGSFLLKVRVRRLPSVSRQPARVRLVVQEQNCPPGLRVEGPDFDPARPGLQDGVDLLPGRSGRAALVVSVTNLSAVGGSALAPRRCRLWLQVLREGSDRADAMPENDAAGVEVNLVDAGFRDLPPHQTAVRSRRPVRLRVGREELLQRRRVAISVTNPDRADPAGHVVRVVGLDGSCPKATVLPPLSRPLDREPQAWLVLEAGRSRSLSFDLVARALDFPHATRRSPARCEVVFRAIGPTGDLDSSNDEIRVPLDVFVE